MFRPRHKEPPKGQKDALFLPNGKKKGVKYINDGHKDEDLPEVNDDPREGETMFINKSATVQSFVRPDMRVIMGPRVRHYPKACKHDDVIVVPNFGCDEKDWSIYYKLVEEMR